MGPDISVEDSLELEKCDHVEDVLPSSPPGGKAQHKVTDLKGIAALQVAATRSQAKEAPTSPASSAASSKKESTTEVKKEIEKSLAFGNGVAGISNIAASSSNVAKDVTQS